MIDQRKIPTAILGLGAYRFPWWDYDATPKYEAVGYFRADVFRPGEWVPTYPNPAFEKMTLRDAFWGAKIVMSFSDEDLRAIVETGRISNPEAEEHLVDILRERRDKIGRYWFDRINPLDRFSIETEESPSVADGSSGASGERSGEAVDRSLLHFDDLAVTGGLETAEGRRYTVQMYLDDDPLGASRTVEDSQVALTVDGTPLRTVLDDRGRTGRHQRVVRVDLRTRQDGDTSSPTRVYVHVPAEREAVRVVGLERK
jgi:hypothetical protein